MSTVSNVSRAPLSGAPVGNRGGMRSKSCLAAIIALLALKTAMRPPDEIHHFGRGKAEYFSAQIEGFMILVAAIVIVWTAIEQIGRAHV